MLTCASPRKFYGIGIYFIYIRFIATVCSGTACVITGPAVTTARSSIRTPFKIIVPAPIHLQKIYHLSYFHFFMSLPLLSSLPASAVPYAQSLLTSSRLISTFINKKTATVIKLISTAYKIHSTYEFACTGHCP